MSRGRKVGGFKVSLLDADPELAEEFDISANGITPDKVSCAESRVQRHWRCKTCNYLWEQSIFKRYKSTHRNCPCCTNRVCVPEINSLTAKNPKLAREWHPTKNYVTPSQIVSGSNELAWWLCSTCGHEWDAIIAARDRGAGCKNCNNHYHTSFPEVAIYFYLQRLFPSAVSRFKVNNVEVDVFIPELNLAIEYDGERYHKDKVYKDEEKNFLLNKFLFIRIREGNLPPLTSEGCINIFVKPGDRRSLDEGIQELLKIVTVQKQLKINLPSIDSRRDQIAIKNLLNHKAKENSVASKHPDLVSRWDFKSNGKLTPYNTSCGSENVIFWLCEKGHSFDAPIYVMTGKNRISCPYCSGQRVLKGFNDLNTVSPMVAKEWFKSHNGFTPYEVTRGVSDIITWKCSSCKGTFTAPVLLRTGKRAQDCPYCVRKFYLYAQLLLEGELVGIRFIYGRRFADVSIETLKIHKIELDLSRVQKFSLKDFSGKYLTKEEVVKNYHIDDYSEDSKFVKRLKKFLDTYSRLLPLDSI